MCKFSFVCTGIGKSFVLLLRQPKVNKVKFFLPCLEVMKRPQTKFQVDATRGFKVIKSRKSQNSALGQKKI